MFRLVGGEMKVNITPANRLREQVVMPECVNTITYRHQTNNVYVAVVREHVERYQHVVFFPPVTGYEHQMDNQ